MMPTPFPTPEAVPEWVESMLRYLGHAFPSWKPTAGTGVVYYDALQDIDPHVIGDAARTYVRQGHEFAPSAGVLRKIALDLRRSRAPHAADCACTPCINALPVAERWLRMSPLTRAQLRRDEPELARQLAEAVPEQVRERVEGVRGLLGRIGGVQ